MTEITQIPPLTTVRHAANPVFEEGVAPVPTTILVVDDCTDSAEMLSLLLKIDGHSVQAAFSGQAALKAIETTPAEVVILDLGMPKLDGFEVAKIIRSQHGPDRIVLIALSGYCRESDRQRCRASGFDHFLVKPVDYRRIRELLAMIFRERRRS